MLKVKSRFVFLIPAVAAIALQLFVLAQSSAGPGPSSATEQVAAERGAAASASGAGFAYFFDLAGDYEKIASATGEEAGQGTIPPGKAEEVASLRQSGFDGCILCGARYDRISGRLYAVMAPDPSHSQGVARNFKVIAIDLPQMKVSGSLPVSNAEPVVLVTPEGDRLLASYQADPAGANASSLRFALSIYSAPALKLVRTLRETSKISDFLAGGAEKGSFSDQAYFGPDGKTIYDRFSKIQLIGDKLGRATIDPSQTLAKSGDKRLEPFELVDARTKAISFAVGYADAAAGKTLVTLNAGRSGPEGMVVLNLDTLAVSAVVRAGLITVSTAHLTPDGGQILEEETELRHPPEAKPDEPQQALFKTGKLLLFNATTGEEIREIPASALSGFDSRLLCLTPGSGLAFFAQHGHLFGVNLVSGTVSQERTGSPLVFDRWTRCVAADR